MDAFRQTKYFNMPERHAGSISDAQRDYILGAIAGNAGVRWTFLFMHKPAWEKDSAENFTAIEDALADRPYTLFNGHLHAYRYLERHGRDYIQLGTTGGSQIPTNRASSDHVMLVTVADDGVDIAKLLMQGILDKTGHVPLGGDEVCFEAATCDQ